MKIFDEMYAASLVYEWEILRRSSACKTFSLYIATSRFIAKLEEELEEFKIITPVQPDPHHIERKWRKCSSHT
jgi:hypothetical protein